MVKMPKDVPFDQEEKPIDLEKANQQYAVGLNTEIVAIGKAREVKTYSNEPFRSKRSITLQEVYVNNERVGNVTCHKNIYDELVPHDVWICGIGYVPMNLVPASFGDCELYHPDKGFIGKVERIDFDWMIQLNKEANLRDLLKTKLV